MAHHTNDCIIIIIIIIKVIFVSAPMKNQCQTNINKAFKYTRHKRWPVRSLTAGEYSDFDAVSLRAGDRWLLYPELLTPAYLSLGRLSAGKPDSLDGFGRVADCGMDTGRLTKPTQIINSTLGHWDSWLGRC